SRPFGVSLLIAGHDENGVPTILFRYYTDPSGTFWQCNGKPIGSGSEGADSSLQEQYNKQVMEEKVTPNNVDIAKVAPTYHVYTPAEVEAVIDSQGDTDNVARQLMQLPVECRDVAALTISYEAQARLANPVHGCVSSIIALQQVVAALQMELLVVQTQLFNNRPTVVNTLHGSLQQPEPVQHLESQPIGSPALTNNTMNDSSLPNAADYHNHAHPHPSFDPFQLSRSQSQNGDNDEENQDFIVFLDHILQSG
ncbi:proteasome subunit alpha type-5, partial [Tanacetum coccineum]